MRFAASIKRRFRKGQHVDKVAVNEAQASTLAQKVRGKVDKLPDRLVAFGVNRFINLGARFYTVANGLLPNAKAIAAAVERDGLVKVRVPTQGWMWYMGASESYIPMADEDRPPQPEPTRAEFNPGRNAACPCGSGQKWKKCCGRNS